MATQVRLHRHARLRALAARSRRAHGSLEGARQLLARHRGRPRLRARIGGRHEPGARRDDAAACLDAAQPAGAGRRQQHERHLAEDARRRAAASDHSVRHGRAEPAAARHPDPQGDAGRPDHAVARRHARSAPRLRAGGALPRSRRGERLQQRRALPRHLHRAGRAAEHGLPQHPRPVDQAAHVRAERSGRRGDDTSRRTAHDQAGQRHRHQDGPAPHDHAAQVLRRLLRVLARSLRALLHVHGGRHDPGEHPDRQGSEDEPERRPAPRARQHLARQRERHQRRPAPR